MLLAKTFGIAVLFNSFNALSHSKKDLILQELKDVKANFCFFIVCWKTPDKAFVQRMIENEANIRSAFLDSDPIPDLNDDNYEKISFVVDLTCPNSTDGLINVPDQNFIAKYSWFLITNESFDLSLDVMNQLVKLRLDLKVKIAKRTRDGSYDIYETYKRGIGVEGVINKIGTYRNGSLSYRRYRYYDSRYNLTGVLVRLGNRIKYDFDDPEIYLEALRHREFEAIVKFHQQAYVHLQEMHGFNSNLSLRAAWFGNTTEGRDGGLAQLLYEDKIDLVSVGAMLKYARIPHYDFLVPYYRFRSCFFLVNSGKVKPGAGILKPFSYVLWWAIIIVGIKIGAIIKLVFWIEHKYYKEVNYSFFTSIVIMVSILSQQASAIYPGNYIGGRILYWNLLIFSLLIYNAYTSSLFSTLLSMKPIQLINSLKDLYESDYKVGLENMAYAIAYIIQHKDKIYVQKLNESKIYSEGYPNFLTPVEGLSRVKKGGFAYHTETNTAYPIMDRLFDQKQICELTEIEFLEPGPCAMYAQKHSQYSEVFKISFVKMITRGIFHRIHKVWIPHKPTCFDSHKVPSVGINPLFLIYVIFVMGIVVAAVLLVSEIIWYRYVEGRGRLVKNLRSPKRIFT